METLLIHKDITVSRSCSGDSGSRLWLSCAGLVRELSLDGGTVKTVSLRLGGEELAVGTAGVQDFYYMGLLAAGEKHPYVLETVKAELVPASFRADEHVDVIIQMSDITSGIIYMRVYSMYTGVPAIGVLTSIKSQVRPNTYWTYRGIPFPNPLPEQNESCQDSFVLTFTPASLESVEFFARTDYTDALVKRHPRAARMNGNLLFATSPGGKGLAILQEAPPSSERRDFEKHDFRLDGSSIFSCCWGIPPAELALGQFQESYRHVILAFTDAADAEHVVKRYMRRRFPLDLERSSAVVIQPWGCGKFGKLISREFLEADITAAPKAGANFYQIDDTWQNGGTLAALSIQNTNITRAFWDVSDALGGSFDFAANAARKAGINLGLWFAPSGNIDYGNWREMADIILKYYRKYGFLMVKLDSGLLRTKVAEDNFRRLIDRLKSESGNKISCNLDTTNGQRQGYFFCLEYGNIFLENRYLCHTWGLGYHPERTLRNLWNLARYTPAQFLQIEVLDPGDTLAEFYEGKRKPSDYSVDYWAAISLFANPLLWFTPSRSKPDVLEAIKPLMELHRQLWPELFHLDIAPVGDAPSGHAVTGFQAAAPNAPHGFLLIFREVDSGTPVATPALPYAIPADAQPELLAGDPDASIDITASIQVTLPATASFALWKY